MLFQFGRESPLHWAIELNQIVDALQFVELKTFYVLTLEQQVPMTATGRPRDLLPWERALYSQLREKFLRSYPDIPSTGITPTAVFVKLILMLRGILSFRGYNRYLDVFLRSPRFPTL